MTGVLRYGASLFVLVGGWKLAALCLGTAMLPPPETAIAAFGSAVKTWAFWSHFLASALRVTAAMALAWLTAFPAGILLGYHRSANRYLSPFVFLTYPIPKIVLLPVFLVLFGLGDLSKIFMIALIIGYQILVATRDSVIGLDPKYIDSFRSLGGDGLQTLRHVVVPAAMPHGFTALRIGCGTGIAVLFFVESFATQRGLGYLIMDAWGRFDYRGMFVGIIGMSLLGVCLYEGFNSIEKTMCAWKFLGVGRGKAVPSSASPLTERAVVYGRMIKFSHTVFALPFALAAVVLAHRVHKVTLWQLAWILVAMVGARSAAMGFNRIVDARFDGSNPRTAEREIPSGRLSRRSAVWFVVLFSALFVLAAGMLSPLCLYLALPVLAVLFLYSYTKRFTTFSHVFLGFSISLAPAGAWIAVTGRLDWSVLSLCMALLFYIAGFDVLYACQDSEFDRQAGLHSIPARWGHRTAFVIAALLHLVAFLFFCLIHLVFDMGPVYLATVAIIGGLLVLEHRLVRPDDLNRIQMAFFNVNSAISITLFLGILLSELAGGG
ncbi:MAG: UbiA-like polyprenyltransferase [Desulfobacterales bacterium]|jgi:putative 4-hydroxybenzoate polyprenyltransferase